MTFSRTYLFISLSQIYFFSQTVSQTTEAVFDYCSITCGVDLTQHTMCAYPAGGGPDCAMFIRGITKTQKNVLIDVHNTLRQGLAMGKGENGQPQAANMVEMVWCDEAAKIAQRWADQCTTGEAHDKCRSLKDKVPGGQNIAVKNENKEVDLYFFQKKTVVEWYRNNSAQYKMEDLKSYKYDASTAAYTQMIWALSERFGCGFSYKQDNDTEAYRLVCNYYPAGNVEGEPVYIEGKPCSRCPYARCSLTYPGVCAPKDKSNWEKGNSDASSFRTRDLYCVLVFYAAFYITLQMLYCLIPVQRQYFLRPG